MKKKEEKKGGGGGGAKEFSDVTKDLPTTGFSFHCCVLTDRSLALSHYYLYWTATSLSPALPTTVRVGLLTSQTTASRFPTLERFIACRLIIPRKNKHRFCAVHCRLLRPEVISEFSPLVHLLHMSSFGVVFWSSPLV